MYNIYISTASLRKYRDLSCRSLDYIHTTVVPGLRGDDQVVATRLSEGVVRTGVFH